MCFQTKSQFIQSIFSNQTSTWTKCVFRQNIFSDIIYSQTKSWPEQDVFSNTTCSHTKPCPEQNTFSDTMCSQTKPWPKTRCVFKQNLDLNKTYFHTTLCMIKTYFQTQRVLRQTPNRTKHIFVQYLRIIITHSPTKTWLEQDTFLKPTLNISSPSPDVPRDPMDLTKPLWTFYSIYMCPIPTQYFKQDLRFGQKPYTHPKSMDLTKAIDLTNMYFWSNPIDLCKNVS